MTSWLFRIRLWLLLVVVTAIVALFLVGRARVTLDSDILRSLPTGDPVLSDAGTVLQNHPMQDRIAIDIASTGDDPAPLLAAADYVERRLAASGLFKRVGLDREQSLFPLLIQHVVDHLPELFGPEDLNELVLPLTTTFAVHRALADAQANLGSLDGIGQAGLIARDPLGLRGLVLARLSAIAPTRNAVVLQGRLVSRDHHHLLVVAEPSISGFDTAFSAKLTQLLETTASDLNRDLANQGEFIVTPVGAYRAALDNETIVKSDTERAVTVSTIAVALLLIFGFRRPLVGLLALFPAVAGTMVGLFVYSLLHRSISMLAIGFGGAVISFTVDYGIAYLLFLDRTRETRGLDVTREVWPLGLLAMLTTAASFLFLFAAGFPALSQLGLFAALGVVFTFLFVHAVYPFLFPTLPPARRTGDLALQRLADWLARGSWPAAASAMLFGLVMLALLRPSFRVDLESMNTVSAETLAAEHRVRAVWGDVLGNVSLLVQSESTPDLARRSDSLADVLDRQRREGELAEAFVPSMVFPGPKRAEDHRAAWDAFWTPDRAAALRHDVAAATEEFGFAPDAFEEFLRSTERGRKQAGSATEAGADPAERLATPMPEALGNLLGVGPSPTGHGVQLYATVRPGPRYDGERFRQAVVRAGGVKVFDPTLFGIHLGQSILHGFMRVLLIVGATTAAISLLYLVHVRLTFIALLPTAFSVVCTLTTLRLLGRPLGIPVIMVCAIVIGMGTDYALYLVRAYQRYDDESHPSLKLVRLSVFLSFATTFAGFGVLALARHAVLQAAGVALALGMAYSFLGTVTLVPPLARRVLAPAARSGAIDHKLVPGSREHAARVRQRYQNLEAYPRLFAHFKLACDPMFERLAEFVGTPRTILDLGCGSGVPAAFLLELLPDAHVYGIDPDAARCEVARRALGDHATIDVDLAPNVPRAPAPADTAMVLDIAHYLDDPALAATLGNLYAALRPGGRLVLRATVPVPAGGRVPRERRVEMMRLRFIQQRAYYRPLAELEKAVVAAGFRPVLVDAPDGREETWIIADRS